MQDGSFSDVLALAETMRRNPVGGMGCLCILTRFPDPTI